MQYFLRFYDAACHKHVAVSSHPVSSVSAGFSFYVQADFSVEEMCYDFSQLVLSWAVCAAGTDALLRDDGCFPPEFNQIVCVCWSLLPVTASD